jgi:uncharacterized membrane protein
MAGPEAPAGGRGGLIATAAVLGVGLSGFFDGILLHQILQWHHLLSLVPGETFREIEVQIFADGAFHVLMYLITAAGLWMLWRRRSALEQAGWPVVAGGGLLGFGLWNVADVGFFHWVLGIHRIRLDVPDPMLYDIGWIVVLGAIPTLLGCCSATPASIAMARRLDRRWHCWHSLRRRLPRLPKATARPQW